MARPRRCILVDAVQSDEGIEDEQPGLEPCDGLLEAATVGIEIEAQAGRGNHLDVEADAGSSTNPVEPEADDQRCCSGHSARR